MKWWRDLVEWWQRESLPFNCNPPLSHPLPLPKGVKSPPPAPRQSSALADAIEEAVRLRIRLEEAEADLVKTHRQLICARGHAAKLDMRIQRLKEDWPKLHATYFTRPGLQQLESPTRKRKK